MSEFLAQVSPEVRVLFDEIVDAMIESFGISRAEAVARVNDQWGCDERFDNDSIILHETDEYWAPFIYYGGDVPDWSGDADRSQWSVRPLPPRNSACWTVVQGPGVVWD